MNKLAKQLGINIKLLTINEHAQRINELLRDVQYQQVVIEITELLKKNLRYPGNSIFI